TLSYFVEPNPGQRGWGTKYRYASHRLQFDVRRSLETVEGFEQRINQLARDTEFNAKNNVKDTGWMLGSNLRKTGSIHSDTWIGTAAELAPRKYVAVYPLNGWWKELKKHERWANQANYSLIISISTPETDIYTEVASQVQSVIEV
ncbi:MAG: subtilase, partial [Thiolinea sp.]